MKSDKAPLGSGERFAALKSQLTNRKAVAKTSALSDKINARKPKKSAKG